MAAAASLAILLAVNACGADDAPAPAASGAPAPATVRIEDLAFEPRTLTVPVGGTVTWTWHDGAVAHDVAGDGFQSDVRSAGTFRHTFPAAGSYDYVCTLHPNMTGTIEVTG